MKQIALLFLVISQVAISYAKKPIMYTPILLSPESEALPAPTQGRDYSGFAKESLQQFYSLIIECVQDPDNQTAFLEGSKDYLDPHGQYVADLMGVFPKDELFSLENYLSEIKMHYHQLLRNYNSIVQIRTDSIEVKMAVPRNKGLELRVSYQVKLLVDTMEKYSGDSEATITYPNINNKYRSQVNSVRPGAYLRYKEAMLNGYNQELWIRLAKEAIQNKDYALVKRLYEDLVQRGHKETLYDLAVLYSDGKGMSVDNLTAAKLYKAYTGRDDLRESLISDKVYILIKQPSQDGMEVWRVVSSQVKERYCNALSFLAYISQSNHDNTTALVNYRKLMYLRPTASVYYNMGLIYADSKDPETYDQELAKEYLVMSADLGYENAKEALDRLNSDSRYR